MDELKEPRLGTELHQRPIKRIRLARGRTVSVALFPRQVVLFGRLDGGVAQPLGVIARHDELHRREERLDEDLPLVVQVLPDARRHGHGGPLQFQHAERHAIHVKDDVRAFAVGLGVSGRDGDFFGQREVVVLRLLPIDEPDRLRGLAHVRLDLHAVAEQVVDGPVAVVEASAGVARRLIEPMKRAGDEGFINPAGLEPRA
ncbi:MAG: hypothetical protein H7A47_12170 [Verrucomicrobiales bacterium]|nr:hypothetical protein [Verrucomicrobiales bacterium]